MFIAEADWTVPKLLETLASTGKDVEYVAIKYVGGRYGILMTSDLYLFLECVADLPTQLSVKQIPRQVFPVETFNNISFDLAQKRAESNRDRLVLLLNNGEIETLVDLRTTRSRNQSIQSILNYISQRVERGIQKDYKPQIPPPTNICGHQAYWKFSLELSEFVCTVCEKPIEKNK